MKRDAMNVPNKNPTESETVMTEVVYPNDANPMGLLHGGRLVQWMDTACAITAQSHAENIAATVSIDKMLFKRPARVGDIITIKAKMTRAFDTSMEIFVQAWARKATGKDVYPINEAYFTFVAMDGSAKPTQVPGIEPVSDIEKAAYAGAQERKIARQKHNHN